MKQITDAQIAGTLVSILNVDALQEQAAVMLAKAEEAVDTLTPTQLAAIASRGYTRTDLVGWAIREAGMRAQEVWDLQHP